MNIINLIKGCDNHTKQERLLRLSTFVRKAVIKRYGFIYMSEAEKSIMFPILTGLEIPFIDCDVNGVLVGDDYDTISDIESSI